MSPSLLLLARVPGPIVTGLLATIGSFGLGFAVMTECSNTYSCSSTGCGPCSATSALLVSSWVLQGVLFVVALALLLPPVVRRLTERRVLALALVVPLVSAVAFAGVSLAADLTYCRPGQDDGGRGDYCESR